MTKFCAIDDPSYKAIAGELRRWFKKIEKAALYQVVKDEVRREEAYNPNQRRPAAGLLTDGDPVGMAQSPAPQTFIENYHGTGKMFAGNNFSASGSSTINF